MFTIIQSTIIIAILALAFYLNLFNLKFVLYSFLTIIISIRILPKLPIKIRTIIFVSGVGVITLVCLPFMIFHKRDYTNCCLATWLTKHYGRILGITVELRGLENIRPEKGSVIIMNHQSCFDLLPVASIWPLIGNITLVAKKELLYVPFFGLGLWLSGVHFIDRQNRKDSINSLNKETRAIQEDHSKLFLFPEGTRNCKEILLPFKKGGFYIALNSKCPIQPIVVSHYSFSYDDHKINHIIAKILPEIDIEFCDNNVNKLTEHCRDLMQNELNILNDEINEMSNLKGL